MRRICAKWTKLHRKINLGTVLELNSITIPNLIRIVEGIQFMKKCKTSGFINFQRIYLILLIILATAILISCAQNPSTAVRAKLTQDSSKGESLKPTDSPMSTRSNDINKIKDDKITKLNSGEGYCNGNLNDLKETITLNNSVNTQSFLDFFKAMKRYKLDTELEKIKLKYRLKDDKPYGVKIERFDTELNNKPGIDTILEVSDGNGDYTNYLIFICDGNNYRLVGNIEFVHTQHHNRPTYRVVNLGNENIWLIVPQVTGSGTGYSLWEEMWYKIDSTMKAVLCYPLRELSAMSGEDLLHFDSVCDVIDYSLNDKGLCQILLRYYITYENGDYRLNSGGEFTTSKLVGLIWDKQQSKFIFNRESGNEYFTQDGYNVFIKGGESDNYYNLFIKEYYIELCTAAIKKENIAWIRSILKECKQCPEKAKIAEVLK